VNILDERNGLIALSFQKGWAIGLLRRSPNPLAWVCPMAIGMPIWTRRVLWKFPPLGAIPDYEALAAAINRTLASANREIASAVRAK
jgi:hypothetical protein